MRAVKAKKKNSNPAPKRVNPPARSKKIRRRAHTDETGSLKKPGFLSHSRSFSWSKARILVKNMLEMSQGVNIYKTLSEHPLVKDISLYDLYPNTNRKTNTKHPLSAVYVITHARGKRRNLPPDGKKGTVLLNPAHPIVRTYSQIANYEAGNHHFYATPKRRDNSKTYYLVIGMTAIAINVLVKNKKQDDEEYIYFLLDMSQRLIIKHILNTTMETQAVIVAARTNSMEYMEKIDFAEIVSGAASLLYSTYGFLRIAFQVSEKMRILFDNHEGYVVNYQEPGGEEKGSFTNSADLFNPENYNESITMYLGVDNDVDNELTIRLWSPNYSRAFIRDTMQITTFITNLKAAFESVFKHRNEQIQTEQKHEELRESSERDYLTKLLNRHGFYSVIARQVNRDGVATIIEIDIDNFKKINDTYGHDAGDRVLQSMAALMNDVFTRNSILARFGGEEFFILIPNLPCEESLRLLDRFRLMIEKKPLRYDFEESGVQKSCTISFTISSGAGYYPIKYTDGVSIEEVLKPYFIQIDKALYHAKQNGKNCIYIHENDNFALYRARSRQDDIVV